MSLRVNFNTSSVRAHFSLQSVDRDLSTTLERLSSGVRIRRAADDPAGLTLANNLRHHLTGMHQAIDNAEEGISMLRTAEGAQGEISASLLRARSLALSAANDGANSPEQLQALQLEFNEIVDSINITARDTRFGSLSLLDGSFSDNTLSTVASDYYAAFTQDNTFLPDGVLANSTMTIAPPSGDLQRAQVSATFDGVPPPTGTTALQGLVQNGIALADLTGDALTVTGPQGSATVQVSNTMTINQFVGLVNAQSSVIGARAQYDEVSGALTIESTSFGSGGVQVDSTDVNANGAGLLDDTPADPSTNGFFTDAVNRTVDISYTDEQGNPQTVTLTQDVNSANGLTFKGGLPREQIISTFAGNPPSTTPLQGLVQNGTTLTDVTGDSVTVTGSEGTVTIPITNTTTIDQFVNLVNAETTVTGARAEYDSATGALTIESTRLGASGLRVDSTDVNANGAGLLDTAPADPAANAFFTNSAGDDAFSLTFRDTSDGSFGSSAIVATANQTAERVSTSFLQIGSLSNQTRRVEISDMRAGALGHGAGVTRSLYRSLQDLADNNALENGQVSVEDAIYIIDAAIAEVNDSRASLGALSEHGLESTLTSLRVGAESLTATESLIRDTDFALESAKFARDNIVYQAATAMLAQANQVPQNILQLLNGG